MQTKDNKTRGIYCHSDGYLDYVGVKLIENYIDETKVEELINLGDLSVLGAEVGHQVDFDDWNAHQLDQCIAYHRDRGEDLNISNIDDVIKWAKDYEYAYLFKNGKWYVYRGGKFQLLSTVLTKKKIKFKSDTPVEKPIKKCETDIVPSDTKHVFEVTCIQDYIEDGECYWSEGNKYICKTNDFITFEINTNLDTVGLVGKNYLCDNFDEYFETSFRITELPCPAKWLSEKLRDEIYRDVWKEHVKEDILTHAEDIDEDIDDEDAEMLAERYVYEGDYDCNLDYWANIENLIDSL